MANNEEAVVEEPGHGTLKTPTCPDCEDEGRVRRARQLPVEKAVEPANPFEPYLCKECKECFWELKEWRRAVPAAILGAALLALILNVGVQLARSAVGHVYRTADRSQLVAGLDGTIYCPACGSNNVCRSTPQPLDRCVLHLHPFTPFRCLDCWHRFWRLKPPLLAVSSSFLGVGVLVFCGTAVLRYRSRRRELMGSPPWLSR